MLAPKEAIIADTNTRTGINSVMFFRKGKLPKMYLVGPWSMLRLLRATNEATNKLYGPRIEVRFGGFQVTW